MLKKRIQYNIDFKTQEKKEEARKGLKEIAFNIDPDISVGEALLIVLKKFKEKML